jgi:hypothetical protein
VTETELVKVDSGLQDLADKILALKEDFRQNFTVDLLDFKWHVGKMLHEYRGGKGSRE